MNALRGPTFATALVFCVASLHAPAAASGQKPADGLCIKVTAGGATRVVPYNDDAGLMELIRLVSGGGGGTLHFGPGTYRFDRGIVLRGIRNIRLVGETGTVFQFRPMPEFGVVRLAERCEVSSHRFRATRPELIRVGGYYQIMRPDLTKNRRIEMTVKSVDGDIVTFAEEKHVGDEVLEKGSWLVPQLNFFAGFDCGDISIRGITFDGNFDIEKGILGGREFLGHTAHGGLLFENPYHETAKHKVKRPATEGVRIVDCQFANFLGRGAVFYNMGSILVRNCRFKNFAAEALEIDHLSRDVLINGCVIENARVGIRLNDCNQVMVSNCSVDARISGIHVTKAMKKPGLNRDITIARNVFRGGRRGVVLDENAEDNIIANNAIDDCRIGILVHGRNNLIIANRIRESGIVGIRLKGAPNELSANLIPRPADAPKTWCDVNIVK